MRGALAPLTVAERLDFLGQAILFLDRDPLKDLQPLLQFLDLLTKALIFRVGLPLVISPIVESRAAFKDRGDHYDRDDQDNHQLAAVHCTLSLLSIRSLSRSASI